MSCLSIANFVRYVKKQWPIIIVGATFVNYLFFSAPLFSYNLLYLELRSSFNSTATQTGIPGAISISLFCFCSILVTIIFQTIGHRATVALGVSLCCLGLLASSFAQRIEVLYVTYGVMYGVGFNACNLTCTDMILRSFDKRNASRATCITFCAVSIGFLSAPCFEWLYATYTWRVSLRILCAVFACIGFPTALVMVEMEPQKTDKTNEIEECIDKGSEELKGINGTNVKTQTRTSLRNYIDIFRRRDLILCLASVQLAASAVCFTFISAGNYLLEKGTDIADISIIIVLMGVGDLVGRILTALFSDRLPISRICQFSVAAIVAIVPSVCLPFISSSTGRIIALIVYSIPRAFFIVILPTIAMEVSSDNTRSEAVAVVYMAFGIGTFITPYLTDSIYDVTGSYDLAWFVCTALYALSAVFMSLAVWARIRENKRNEWVHISLHGEKETKDV